MLSTPEFDHLVLARQRADADTGEKFDGLAQAVEFAPSNLLAASRAVSRAYSRHRTDIVHAHSSYGGVWVRLARVPSCRIVYTPHCYAFERRDVPAIARIAYRQVERVLAHRTGSVIGVSPRELELSRELNRRQRGAYVPNVARVPGPNAHRRSVPSDRPLTIVGAGRLCPQKGPSFFGAVARRLQVLAPEFRIRWLGGGSASDEQMLRSHGVDVTGWMERTEILRSMAAADVYLHTAAWEGAPVTVLEAAASGLPIVARRIPALESLGLSQLESSPAGVAERINALREPATYSQACAEGRALHHRHLPEQQRAALLQVYRSTAAACGRS